MTEILMCEKFYKQMHPGTNYSSWIDAASERSPILMEHTHLNIHVKEFNNLFLKFVIRCLFLCIYRQLDAIIISAVISLNKLTWKLSCATHPVCSNIT